MSDGLEDDCPELCHDCLVSFRLNQGLRDFLIVPLMGSGCWSQCVSCHRDYLLEDFTEAWALRAR